MKKIIFIIALFISSSYTYAQQSSTKTLQTSEERASEVVTKLKNDISLTDEQVSKVNEITVVRINKVTDNHKKYGADKNRIKASNKLAFDEWETQLKTIVSMDQFNKYLSLKGQN